MRQKEERTKREKEGGRAALGGNRWKNGQRERRKSKKIQTEIKRGRSYEVT